MTIDEAVTVLLGRIAEHTHTPARELRRYVPVELSGPMDKTSWVDGFTAARAHALRAAGRRGENVSELLTSMVLEAERAYDTTMRLSAEDAGT